MSRQAKALERFHPLDAVSAPSQLPSCPPNAAKMIWSLRNTDVDNYQALADITDNSIDANADASSIWVQVCVKNNEPMIFIADNGAGMNKDRLHDAMKLGSLEEKDAKSDNGKFGVGLVLSSISIAKSFQVITRSSEGCWTSRFDIETIQEQKDFVLDFLRPATDEENASLDACITDQATGEVARTGTVVILTKCDRMTDRNASQFANTLAKKFKRIYRYHINGLGGRKRDFYVNGKKLEAFDPLHLDDPQTESLYEIEYPFTFTGSDGRTVSEMVKVRLVLVPDEDTGSSDKEDKLQELQGLYFMRNWREIAGGKTMGFWAPRREYNRLRGEIFFTGELDEAFGVNFQKQLAPKGLSQKLFDTLRPDIKNNVNNIARKSRKDRTASTDERQDEVRQLVMKGLQEKDKFLHKPTVMVERRDTKRNQEDNSTDAKAYEGSNLKPRHNFTATQDKYGKINYELNFENLSSSGPIYDAYQEGNKVIITLNVQHGFYQRFVLDYLDESGRIPVLAEHIVCSMALSELRLDEDGQKMFRPKFISEMSANLSVMLS